MNVQRSASEIEEAAIRWVWRFDREGDSASLQKELDTWLSEDTRHRGAFLHAQAVWCVLDRAYTPASEQPRKSRKLAVAAAAAALLAVSVALALFFDSTKELETSLGEIRQVPLGDGSTAAINTHSSIRISMKANERLVELREGEAWFRVAKDPGRPFTVEAGRVRVRAVGTAFSVRLRESGADVLVTEGVVETWVEGAEGHRMRVTAGDRASVAENAVIDKPPTAAGEIDRALAWRTGKIDLAGETLAYAANEFNRYNGRKLRVMSPELARKRFYGVFRTDDPEGFAQAVKRSLQAEISFSHQSEIVIDEPERP
jgi:transmembrane sensor